jgi:uncharacterized protein with PQ loop repeat
LSSENLMDVMRYVGAFAGFILPVFNIPLIIRMVRRKSSDDLSLIWVGGVWVCILLMSPAALTSEDFAFRAFGITNLLFFSAVTYVAFKYRLASEKKPPSV